MGAAPRGGKPCPQASALRLCSPLLRFALSASLQRWVMPLGLPLLPPLSPARASRVLALPNTQYPLLAKDTKKMIFEALQPAEIPLNKLLAWNGNFRTTAVDEAIAAVGLLQNLVVRKEP